MEVYTLINGSVDIQPAVLGFISVLQPTRRVPPDQTEDVGSECAFMIRIRLLGHKWCRL